MANTLPTGSTAITDPNNPNQQLAVNSNGSINVQSTFTEQTSLSAASLNADLVPSIDVSAYKSISLHIGTSAYSGTITFQCSNDNTNWVTTYVIQPGFNNPVTTTSATNVMFFVPVCFRFFRARMTAYSSGTATGTAEYYSVSLAPNNINANITSLPGTTLEGDNPLTSTTISSNGNSSDRSNNNSRGMYVYLTSGAQGSGASNIVFTVKGKDPASGAYYTILQSAAIGANSNPGTSAANVLLIYPGVSAVANQVANQPLPKTWRLEWTASNWGTGGSVIGASDGLLT